MRVLSDQPEPFALPGRVHNPPHESNLSAAVHDVLARAAFLRTRAKFKRALRKLAGS